MASNFKETPNGALNPYANKKEGLIVDSNHVEKKNLDIKYDQFIEVKTKGICKKCGTELNMSSLCATKEQVEEELKNDGIRYIDECPLCYYARMHPIIEKQNADIIAKMKKKMKGRFLTELVGSEDQIHKAEVNRAVFILRSLDYKPTEMFYEMVNEMSSAEPWSKSRDMDYLLSTLRHNYETRRNIKPSIVDYYANL